MPAMIVYNNEWTYLQKLKHMGIRVCFEHYFNLIMGEWSSDNL